PTARSTPSATLQRVCRSSGSLGWRRTVHPARSRPLNTGLSPAGFSSNVVMPTEALSRTGPGFFTVNEPANVPDLTLSTWSPTVISPAEVAAPFSSQLPNQDVVFPAPIILSSISAPLHPDKVRPS